MIASLQECNASCLSVKKSAQIYSREIRQRRVTWLSFPRWWRMWCMPWPSYLWCEINEQSLVLNSRTLTRHNIWVGTKNVPQFYLLQLFLTDTSFISVIMPYMQLHLLDCRQIFGAMAFTWNSVFSWWIYIFVLNLARWLQQCKSIFIIFERTHKIALSNP